MRAAGVILVALLILAVAAFAVGRDWLLGTDYPAPPLAGRFEQHELRSGDATRRFSWYEPPALIDDAPILFALHGSAGDGARMRTGTAQAFEVLADRDGFIVVYPDAFERTWNDCRVTGDFESRRRGIDDVEFFSDMLAYFRERYPAGDQPVFVVGLSSGGHMVFRLALEAPELIDAAVAIAANMPADSNLDCKPVGQAVPMLLISGTEDPINPYGGGEVKLFGIFGSRGEVLGARASAEYWAALAGHDASPFMHRYPDVVATDGSVADRAVWTGDGRPEVGLISVRGGGHTIPHPVYRMPGWLGRGNRDFAAADEIWRFFQRAVSAADNR